MVMRDGKNSGSGKVAGLKKSDLVTMIIGEETEKVEKVHGREMGEEVLWVENIQSGNLLQGVSFSLRKGEILGIWGLMGSGRTELLRAMFGLDRVDGGEVYRLIDGKKQKVNKRDFLRQCGYVTESRHTDGLFLQMDVARNATAATLDKYSSKMGKFINEKREVKDAEELIRRLNIKVPDALTKLYQLSGGNQQKVIFAKWMNRGADILVLDEPTRGVEVGSKMEIYKIQSLADNGTSVLLVSSEVDEMIDLSDRVIVLQGGRIVNSVSGHEINNSRLMELALGEGREAK